MLSSIILNSAKTNQRLFGEFYWNNEYIERIFWTFSLKKIKNEKIKNYSFVNQRSMIENFLLDLKVKIICSFFATFWSNFVKNEMILKEMNVYNEYFII